MSEDDNNTLNIEISGPAGSHRLGTAIAVAKALRARGVEVTVDDPDGAPGSEAGEDALRRLGAAGPDLRAVIKTRQTPREPAASASLTPGGQVTHSFSETESAHAFRVTLARKVFSFKDSADDEVVVPLEHAGTVAGILLGVWGRDAAVVRKSDLHLFELAAINAERTRRAADQAREAATNVDKEARAAEQTAEEAATNLNAVRSRILGSSEVVP